MRPLCALTAALLVSVAEARSTAGEIVGWCVLAAVVAIGLGAIPSGKQSGSHRRRGDDMDGSWAEAGPADDPRRGRGVDATPRSCPRNMRVAPRGGAAEGRGSRE